MSPDSCGRSLLSAVDDAIRQLCLSPGAPGIEATQLGLEGYTGVLSVLELREVVGRRDTPVAVKNRAWALLITQAQKENQQPQPNDLAHGGDRVWALAAIAVALPGLRAVCRALADGARGATADLEAEVLAGFLAALMQARTPGQQRFPALMRAARHAGVAWLRHNRDAPPAADDATTGPLVGVAAVHAGHPDGVLADAVEAAILTEAEAELIAATRLERQPLRDIAAAHGISVNAVWMRRDRAEKRLVAALARACRTEDAHDITDGPAVPGHRKPNGRVGSGRGHALSVQSSSAPGQLGRQDARRGHHRRGQRPGLSAIGGQPDRGHSDSHQPGTHLSSGGRDSGHADAGVERVPRFSQSTAMREPSRRMSVDSAAVPTDHQDRVPVVPVWITLLMLVVGLALSGEVHSASPRGGPISYRSPGAVVVAAFVTPTATVARTLGLSPRELQRIRWSRHHVDRPGRSRLTRPVVMTQASADGTAQLTRVLTNIRNWLLGLLITLATLCLTIGGVRYLLAGGDPGEVEAAKRAIKSAAIGYALAVLAPAFVAVLRNLVGA